ncbi:hypothetical protein ccbrp13_28160 [Ktedonobacteria bacterium brp13]|nr:hypothetical protein ccbrp13_28160 [Ktedonobacteria bacterium brp13]
MQESPEPEEARGRRAIGPEVEEVHVRLRSPGGREHAVSRARGAAKAFIETQMPDRPQHQQLTQKKLSKLMSGEQQRANDWSLVEVPQVPHVRLRSPGGSEYAVSRRYGAGSAFIKTQMPGRPQNQRLTQKELSKLMSGELQSSHGWSLVEEAGSEPEEARGRRASGPEMEEVHVRLRSPGGREHAVSRRYGAAKAFIKTQMPGRPQHQQLTQRGLSKLMRGDRQRVNDWSRVEEAGSEPGEARGRRASGPEVEEVDVIRLQRLGGREHAVSTAHEAGPELAPLPQEAPGGAWLPYTNDVFMGYVSDEE